VIQVAEGLGAEAGLLSIMEAVHSRSVKLSDSHAACVAGKSMYPAETPRMSPLHEQYLTFIRSLYVEQVQGLPYRHIVMT
jgi:hypothetical protein